MTDLRIDTATNTLDFTNGDVVLTSPGLDAVAQRLALRFSLFLGEWFLDTSAGTPWREQILVRPVDLTAVRGILLNRALTCRGVASVQSFDLDLDAATRELSFSFRVGIDSDVPGLGDITDATGAGLILFDDPELLCIVEMSGSFL